LWRNCWKIFRILGFKDPSDFTFQRIIHNPFVYTWILENIRIDNEEKKKYEERIVESLMQFSDKELFVEYLKIKQDYKVKQNLDKYDLVKPSGVPEEVQNAVRMINTTLRDRFGNDYGGDSLEVV